MTQAIEPAILPYLADLEGAVANLAQTWRPDDPHYRADIYRQTVARQFLQEKKEMVNKLRQYGIQAILTKPQDLTLNTINKYLELKSRGLI